MNTYSYREIAKNIKFLCVNSDKFKTNCVRIDFYLPITEKLSAQNVLSSFLGHTSKKYNTFKSFNARLEELYGACLETGITTVGESAVIRFGIESIDDKFALNKEKISEETVDFLIEILEHPNCDNESFDKEYTEREIRFALETLEAGKNDKRAYALSRLRFLMCQNEKFGIDKDKLEREIKELNGKDLYNAYVDMLKSSTIVITACGSLDENVIYDKFSDFAKFIGERNPQKLETVFVKSADKVRYFDEDMKVKQSKLVMGLRVGMENAADNYYAYRVMTDIFGGGPYSRLFLNVREKKSLCYYCSSLLVRNKGVMFIQSGIEKENYEKALSEILNQLDIMKKGEFTDEDFDSSLKALSDLFRRVEDSPSSVCAFYASQAFDDEILSGRSFAHKILHVTKDEVKECAKKVTLDSVYLLRGEASCDE